MFYWQLGTRNAKRNLERSSLTILSLFIAAGFLTWSLSLANGYPRDRDAAFRAQLGGDIIVYCEQFDGAVPEADTEWVYRNQISSSFTDLKVFQPQIFNKGYLHSGSLAQSFNEETLQALSEVSEVFAVYPRLQIPTLHSEGSTVREIPLRGRDPSLDALLTTSPRQLLCEGRWFLPEDEGKNVCIVSRHQLREGAFESDCYQPGETISLECPRIVYVDGVAEVSFLETSVVDFEIIGIIEVRTRFYYPVGVGAAPLPFYWYLDEVQIPKSSFENIWKAQGGERYLPRQLSLIARDMAYLEDIAKHLRSLFPETTIISAPEQLASAERQFLIENTFLARQYFIQFPREQQLTMNLDVREYLILLIFANASLVMAANTLILASERRREIGILKAIGSLRRDIAVMVISESLFLSFAGMLLGFLFFRIPGVFTQLTNRYLLRDILGSFASDAERVLIYSAAFSLIFALVPAWRVSGFATQEVFSDA